MLRNKKNQKKIAMKIAKELLEYRLGIEATEKHIEDLTKHLMDFENEADEGELKKQDSLLIRDIYNRAES